MDAGVVHTKTQRQGVGGHTPGVCAYTITTDNINLYRYTSTYILDTLLYAEKNKCIFLVHFFLILGFI